MQHLTSLFFFAGGTVSEEKQKDAGHFDPLCHSHCSNYYSFWNKVLIMHSSWLFVFCVGVLSCICVDLDSVSVLLKTKLTAFHTRQETTKKRNVSLQVHWRWFVCDFKWTKQSTICLSRGCFYQVSHTQIAKTLWPEVCQTCWHMS